jgi:hypothetical protein
MNKPTENAENNNFKPRGRPFRRVDDKPKLDPKIQLNTISNFFFNSAKLNYHNKFNEYEMEAKFGTKGIKQITKLDYDNVVKKLKSLGYAAINEKGTYSLKIQPEFIDTKTGKFKTSADIDIFRVEIKGLSSIQEYCKTNNLRHIIDGYPDDVKLLRKSDVKEREGSENNIGSADFNDFNFRVSIKNENTIAKTGKIGQELIDKWNDSKKVFRYMNRVSFMHPLCRETFPFRVDISIVKSSTKNDKGWMMPTYNIDESNVFQNQEIFEIEIEVLPSAKQLYKQSEELTAGIQKVIKDVLCGLQKTNYPISYPEQKETLQNYHKLLFEDDYIKKGETYITKNQVYPSDFIGPSLVTLGIINVGPLNPDIIVPNINEPFAYCVTEKADGDRHLMYVNPVGKIYLINMNMSVIFTGAKTTEEKCFNSLLDGELILHNKKHQFINTFAVFDIYYVNKVDVRARPFIQVITKDEKYFKNGCRLPMLKEFVKIINPNSTSMKPEAKKGSMLALLSTYKVANRSPITIISKKFYPTIDLSSEGAPTSISAYNIFEANNYLLRKIADNLFDYEIDGLIFTPTLLGVGGNKIWEAGPKKKITWPYLFKWKPSEATQTFPQSYNTIDFLVVTKKGSDGLDVVIPIFENGINTYETTQYNQYKTLVLAVGFDKDKHGYINPCQDILDDKNIDIKGNYGEEGYRPKQFFPSNPCDPLAGLCNIMLELDANGSYQMFTEEREVFGDQTIVEFRYDLTKSGMWKWIPMRVRYDKTADFMIARQSDFKSRQGIGANDYNTANSNWNSIHNPVTERMIATGEGIPGMEVSDDVYYNSVTNDKLTQRMRDFHNLYVKKSIIQGVSKKGNTLIDFACGKAGDLPKWIGAGLSFVLGIDIAKDNLENRLNGSCARYLNFKTTTKNIPYALFVNGNSSKNIRSGTNMLDDKANEIIKSVFGSTGINKSLGPAVERQHGKGINGFDVSSCQFALHYMFENKVTFYNFMRNVAECTKLNGYFIATCYDGRTMFNMLKKKEEGESKDIYIDDKKIWSVTKTYDALTLEDNETCLGYKIDVYQDSINKSVSEYLVNFDFLTMTMDKYGFTLVSREEARHMGLPEGSGMFSELYNSMMNEIKRDPKKEGDYKDAVFMKDYEKDISFLNRFFVYKKTSTRNSEKLTKVLLDQLPDTIDFEQKGTMLAQEAVEKAEEQVRPRAKKLSEKLKLQDATEALEEEAVPVTKKKTTRKKKAVEFEIIDEA